MCGNKEHGAGTKSFAEGALRQGRSLQVRDAGRVIAAAGADAGPRAAKDGPASAVDAADSSAVSDEGANGCSTLAT